MLPDLPRKATGCHEAVICEWLNHVESALGIPPVIYTGRFFWEDNVASSDYADHPLWIADYSAPTCPRLPSQWADWVFWQDSSTGEITGINALVGTNVFNGDLAALKDLGKPDDCGGEICPGIFIKLNISCRPFLVGFSFE